MYKFIQGFNRGENHSVDPSRRGRFENMYKCIL